eukprot:SAG25_NODE_6972_length_514_cov_1.836145_2_plen_56_part_01
MPSMISVQVLLIYTAASYQARTNWLAAYMRGAADQPRTEHPGRPPTTADTDRRTRG